jgi:queuine tRNA-ribosyltransferase
MSKVAFSFTELARSGKARAGEIVTPHGTVQTPVFMPVGTQASVKSLISEELENMGARMVLANTYHLHLRPGEDTVSDMGGLHGFMRYEGSILTDSGGYQVSSLGSFKREGTKQLSIITEEGVHFTSHIDGSKHFIGPEESIDIQVKLGADIIMAFDEATPERDRTYAKASMERTHRWLKRCVFEFDRLRGNGQDKGQALFGIVQGGHYRDLRRESAKVVVSYDLPGLALGGASVGQSNDQTAETVDWVRDLLPASKPLYLMGVGTRPADVVAAILAGADMFDCVAPTRWARCGLLYTGYLHIDDAVERAAWVSEDTGGRLSIGQKKYARDAAVIDKHCVCATCTYGYSRAYLHHLFKARELAYYRMASVHNVTMMLRTATLMREMILGGDKDSLDDKVLRRLV